MKKITYFCLLLCFGISLKSQNIIYVDQNASGNNTGVSWGNAFTDLQPALDSAAQGDEIWVAKGIYYPSKDNEDSLNPADPRTKTFVMKNGVEIYGGFQSGDNSKLQRDWLSDTTILSGNIGQSGDSTDNCYHVITNDDNNLNYTARLDGFWIQGGHYDSNTSGGLFKGGGGIYNYQSSPSLVNLVIRRNFSQNRGGGAVNDKSSTYMANLIVYGNQSYFTGGGICNSRGPVKMINLLVFNNAASGNGKGIYNIGIESTNGPYECYNTAVFNNFEYDISGQLIRGIGDFYNWSSTGKIGNCYFETFDSFVNPTTPSTFQNCLIPDPGNFASLPWNTNYGIDVGGNQDTSLIFKDTINGDFSLKHTSPGINEGMDTIIAKDIVDIDQDGNVNEPFPVDLHGMPRIIGGTVDIGPLERMLGYIDTSSTILCKGANYNFNGQTIHSPGIYTTRYILPQTDSLVTLTITSDSVDASVNRSTDGTTLTSVGDSGSYQWFDCDLETILNNTGPSLTSHFGGVYALIVTNNNGCIDTSGCLRILPSVSLNEAQNESISLFPNPADDILTVQGFTGEKGSMLRITSSTCKTIQTQSLEGLRSIKIPVKDLSPGLYFIRLQSGDQSQQLPFLKE